LSERKDNGSIARKVLNMVGMIKFTIFFNYMKLRATHLEGMKMKDYIPICNEFIFYEFLPKMYHHHHHHHTALHCCKYVWRKRL